MEKSREALLEEQRATLAQLHKERQALTEDQLQYDLRRKADRDEGTQYAMKAVQAKAELEALTRAVADARDRYERQKEEAESQDSRITAERRRMEKERVKMENKEAELLEAANMVQERSREMEDVFAEGQQKYGEGVAALTEAQRLEGEQGLRIDTVNKQLATLRAKEKDMAEERLRLSKDKLENEKLRNTLLCPNCRTPGRLAPGTVNQTQDTGLLVPVTGNQTSILPMSNGEPLVGGAPMMNGAPGSSYISPLTFNPALQLSVNTVDAVTEAIKSDRSIRLMKVEAMKDQKYLEEQSMFLYTLKHMPYSPKV